MVRVSTSEERVLRFLLQHFTEKYSINQLAKRVQMTPKGAQKLLRRLEAGSVVVPERLANAVFYSVNLSSDYARKRAELSLFDQHVSPYVRAQMSDLERLHPFTHAGLLFGSVLQKGEKAGDIDILVILDKKSLKPFQKALEHLQRLKTKRVHPIFQTLEDFKNNLRKKDDVILDALRTGNVLWGQEVIVNALKKVTEQ